MAIRPQATAYSKSRTDSLVICTKAISKILDISFEEAFFQIHGETQAYTIGEPEWAQLVPAIRRSMQEHNLQYKVVEFKWGMRLLSVELWYTVLGPDDCSGAWPVHTRVRISDQFNREQCSINRQVPFGRPVLVLVPGFQFGHRPAAGEF